MSTTPGPGRDRRIDLFRGAALLFIFWDHVPGSLLGRLTPRNLGLSDAAEVFVLLAGWAAMAAYGGTFLRHGPQVMALRALRRVGQLYVAHVFLLALLMGVVFVANDQVVSRDFVGETGLTWFLEHPRQALVAGLMLTFKPMMMDPLPLYILLVVLVPLLVPALIRRPGATLGASFLLWLFATTTHVDLPARPEGVWFFNPLAWQFLFVIGAWLARPQLVPTATASGPAALAGAMAPVAVVFLVASAVLALSWRWPAVHDALVPRRIAEAIYPISKTHLAPLRLVHILALAVCVWRFVPQGPWLDSPLARNLAMMGRHSLHVFCAGVLLTPVADTVNALHGDGAVVQVVTGLVGALLMCAVALVLEEYRRLPGGAPSQAGARSAASTRLAA